jgi:hypothetical protein
MLHTASPSGADGAKARSPKRSDGSLRRLTGEECCATRSQWKTGGLKREDGAYLCFKSCGKPAVLVR